MGEEERTYPYPPPRNQGGLKPARTSESAESLMAFAERLVKKATEVADLASSNERLLFGVRPVGNASEPQEVKDVTLASFLKELDEHLTDASERLLYIRERLEGQS